MADFPTLSRTPRVVPFSRTAAVDPTIRSPMESGHVQTRSRFTRVPRRWAIYYDALPNADKLTLATFETDTAVFGAVQFDWTNPEDSVSYVVKFGAPLIYNPWKDTNYNYWVVEFPLIEE